MHSSRIEFGLSASERHSDCLSEWLIMSGRRAVEAWVELPPHLVADVVKVLLHKEKVSLGRRTCPLLRKSETRNRFAKANLS